jgi:predicted amidohydrolase
VKVAGVQLDIAWEDPETNFRRVDEHAAVAAAGGARLLVLPEMFATGFSMNAATVSRHAEKTRGYLADLARHHGLFVLGGYAEPGDPLAFNACSIYDPAGEELLHYRKVHPFTLADEHKHYQGGEEVLTVEVEGVRVTPFICYDLRFPELFRAAAERTDLFVVVANWPEKRSDAWRILLRARAAENQAFVLGVNRVGEGSGEPHRGDSTLADPFGRVVETARDQEEVVTGEVDPKAVYRARRAFGFLADRRPDVYRRL